MKKQNFIGIDGGATYIRVVIADYDGNILSHIKYHGGAAIQKNDNPQENMRDAIILALKQANVHPESIIAIGAGISSYDDDEDLVWVNTLIDIEDLNCPIMYVNDAEIAHVGAFNEKSGSLPFAEQVRSFSEWINSVLKFVIMNLTTMRVQPQDI